MGDFEGKRWRPYLDQEAQSRRDEILDHLEGNYDGPSDFVKQKLLEESALSMEERIERQESRVKEEKRDLKRLKRVKRERDEQTALRDKKELLKEKQKRLESIDSDTISRHKAFKEIVNDVEEKADKKSMSDTEYVRSKWPRICRRANHRLEQCPDVDELVEDVVRLQREIRELNSGDSLDCFMDLDEQLMEGVSV